MNKPIHLKPCCKQTLELIATKTELANFATELVVATPFIQMLAGLKPIDLLITVGTTDLQGLARLAIGMEKIRKLAIQKDINTELALHLTDPELSRFWKELRQTFN